MTPVLPWTLPFLKVCTSFNSWSNFFCQRYVCQLIYYSCFNGECKVTCTLPVYRTLHACIEFKFLFYCFKCSLLCYHECLLNAFYIKSCLLLIK